MNVLIPVADYRLTTGEAGVRDHREKALVWVRAPTKLVGGVLCVPARRVYEADGLALVEVAGRTVWTTTVFTAEAAHVTAETSATAAAA